MRITPSSPSLHAELSDATLALALETAFTPADSAAKLRMIVQCLRDELHPEDTQRLT